MERSYTITNVRSVWLHANTQRKHTHTPSNNPHILKQCMSPACPGKISKHRHTHIHPKSIAARENYAQPAKQKLRTAMTNWQSEYQPHVPNKKHTTSKWHSIQGLQQIQKPHTDTSAHIWKLSEITMAKGNWSMSIANTDSISRMMCGVTTAPLITKWFAHNHAKRDLLSEIVMHKTTCESNGQQPRKTRAKQTYDLSFKQY